MVFLSLAGSIGAGLFVASGSALSSGGGGNAVLNYAVVGFMICTTMGSLGELATTFPVAGAFYDYADRFLGEHWGFAIGWMFVLNWITVLPFELTTMGAQMKFWLHDLRPEWAVGPILFCISCASFLGSKVFGEIEHWLGVGKVLACTVFIIVAIITAAGGIPQDTRQPKPLGFHYYANGAAFKNGFAGFLAVFRVAGMSYNGTELLAMTARECKTPEKAMPLGTYLAFFRIAVFYVIGVLCLGLVIPSDHPDLSQTGHGAKFSPFALAAQLAGIPGLAHFFNAMILAALLSMANMAVFATSRALQALCTKGCGPAFLSKVNRKGVPYYAQILTLCAGLLAFINAAPEGAQIFDWLLSIAATFGFYVWIAIAVSHIRYRRALSRTGVSPKSLIFASPFGVWGSYFTIFVGTFALLANPLSAVFPLKGSSVTVASVMRENVGMLVPWIFWACHSFSHYIKNRKDPNRKKWTVFKPIDEVDVVSGRVVKQIHSV
ncbi:hypothetical protein jhhlp_006099 [Lomentospora prolificans]|uniref:Amino acid permease/ SLC12A domain-containing protein n=1 Tax=Lomentospora prolificans TaxID=41688 RepID=A0A2N3N4Z1_9PEZI|nr:hypothetical protein jhhlp_006099 [Lomentospora prolificans]